jgi:signal transduction histidine kinase
VEEQRLVHPHRQGTLAAELDSLRMPLDADADRIGQVIINYVTNALKYSTDDKPVAVYVRRDGRMTRLSVTIVGADSRRRLRSESGSGIYRVKDVTVLSGSEIGLGLGFYISGQINRAARAH